MSGNLISGEIPETLASSKEIIETTIIPKFEKLLEVHHDPKAFLGWIHLPEDSSAITEINRWLKTVPKSQTVCCVLGIGGSCLGAKAVYDFLQPQKELLFFDNVDGHS